MPCDKAGEPGVGRMIREEAAPGSSEPNYFFESSGNNL
jgi:hypothetical protein